MDFAEELGIPRKLLLTLWDSVDDMGSMEEHQRLMKRTRWDIIFPLILTLTRDL